MSHVQFSGVQSHHSTPVLTLFVVLPSCRDVKNVEKETLQLLVLRAKHSYFLITK